MGESQEDTNDLDCQKCGKAIQQVPYKYAGKYFHARCLTCNSCGKKLAGKPFLCVEHKIFCGDQCQDSYQEPIRSNDNGATISVNIDTDSDKQTLANGHSGAGDESLLDALTGTETTSSPLPPLPRTPPRSSSGVTLTRITDYPRHSLSQSPPGSIRRSSLSVSESSLTSSFTSDSGSPGQPRKRILKKPHGPRKHKSNRVHWNIPEEGGGGDGVSLLSFESTSTTSGVSPSSFVQAREGVSEFRRNWREFEELPPPGSTGLTPMKQQVPLAPLAPLRENLMESVDHTPLLSSPSKSPPARCPNRYSTGTSDIGTRQRLSPLYYSTQLGSGVPHHTSTPLRRHSDSTVLTSSSSTSQTTEIHNGGIDALSVQNSAHSSVAPPPVLRLDHSNLSELEASTFEDRAKTHLFEFPPISNGGPPTIPMPPTYSGYIPPAGQAHLCGGSDADDYDHLSPEKSAVPPQTLAVANRSTRFDLFPQPSKTRGENLARLGSPPLPPEKPPTPVKNPGDPFSYRENDIDEALNELTDSASSRSGSSAPQSPLLDPSLTGPLTQLSLGPGGHKNDDDDDGEIPPPVPPKLNRRKSNSPTTRVSNNFPPNQGGSLVPPGKSWSRPPEFATVPTHPVEVSSEDGGGHDDALSSVSTATLVPSEPGDSVPPSVYLSQNNQRIKPNHSSNKGVVSSTATVKTHPSVRVHPEIFPPHSFSAPTHQSWESQWKESGTTSFAPHPPPLPYHQPLQFAYPHESQLHPIEENVNPERQALISISNSGSDSSLRGASPPDKISQASVIPFDRNFYMEDSLSQPLPTRPLSASTNSTRGGSNSTAGVRAHFQAPQFNSGPSGGITISRNHRFYHSHRSGLAPRPRLQKFTRGGFVPPPQPLPGSNKRPSLKFQYSLDLDSNSHSEEVPALTWTYSPPFLPMALSQDDPPLGTTFYPSAGGGLAGGRGLLPRPHFRSVNQTQVHQDYPFISQGHTHKPHPSQGHTYKPHPSQRHTHKPHPSHGHAHQPHPSQGQAHQPHPSWGHAYKPHPLQAHHQNSTHMPQLLKPAHSMTSV